MKKKWINYVLLLFLVVFSGCSQKESDVVTKEVEIFGTKYTIHDDWTVDKSSENTMIIYYVNEKPEKIDDAVMITLIPDKLKNGKQYYQSEEYISLLKNSLLPNLLEKVEKEERCDKEKTAGIMCKGQKNGFDITVYFFMNNYTDAVLIQCYHHPERGNQNHSEYEKEIIDSMDFSFEGFTKVASSQTSSSNKNTSNSNENNDKELAKRVYNWCQDRFDYYDKKDGYYTGDKHDDDVFEDAAKHFGRSKSEVKKLYDDGGYYIVKGE